VAIGIAEMLAILLMTLSLSEGSRRDPVARIVREQDLPGRGRCRRHHWTDPERINFRVAGLGIDSEDLRDAAVRRNADIEGRSEGM